MGLRIVRFCRSTWKRYEVRLAEDDRPLGSHVDRGAVARFWAFWRVAVDFLQHRKVDVVSKGICDRFDVNAVTVGRQLNAISQAFREIANEMMRCASVSTSDQQGTRLVSTSFRGESNMGYKRSSAVMSGAPTAIGPSYDIRSGFSIAAMARLGPPLRAVTRARISIGQGPAKESFSIGIAAMARCDRAEA
jgi:hypothetical protein